MEEGRDKRGWVAFPGCVGDSAPRQPLVVSAGSCTLVAMATPPQTAGEARQTGLLVLRGA